MHGLQLPYTMPVYASTIRGEPVLNNDSDSLQRLLIGHSINQSNDGGKL